MPLFGPYTDKVGPVVSAAFLNTLDQLQNTVQVDANGGINIPQPTAAEPTLVVNAQTNQVGLGVVGGTGLTIASGALTGGVDLFQDPTGFLNLINPSGQGFRATGGSFLNTAAAGISAAIGVAGDGALPANALLLRDNPSPSFGQIAYRGRVVASVNPQGAWTIPAPSAGVTLSVAGIAGTYAESITTVTTLNKSFGLQIFAGSSNLDFALSTVNAAGSASLFAIRGDGVLLGLGPYGRSQFLALTDMTPDTGTFVGTLTGFSGSVSGTFSFFRVGNLVTVYYPGGQISGSSNSVSMALTGVPSSLWAAGAAQLIPVTNIIDAGVTCMGIMQITPGGTFNFFVYNVSGVRILAATFQSGGATKGITSGVSFTYSLV